MAQIQTCKKIIKMDCIGNVYFIFCIVLVFWWWARGMWASLWSSDWNRCSRLPLSFHKSSVRRNWTVGSMLSVQWLHSRWRLVGQPLFSSDDSFGLRWPCARENHILLSFWSSDSADSGCTDDMRKQPVPMWEWQMHHRQVGVWWQRWLRRWHGRAS